MHLGVLGNSDSWYLRDLQRAAADRHQVTAVPFSELACRIDDDGIAINAGPVRFDVFDAVLVRSMPPGSLEQVVFRMDLLARCEAAGMPVINPPRAVEAAVDKFLTSAKLQAAGLRTPKTIVCQTADEAMAAFDTLGRDVVVKPLFGSEGRGIARLEDAAMALRAFRMLERLGAVLYVQEFIAHEGCDLRLLIIGHRIFGMRRRNALDWRTNISCGAHGEPLEVTHELAELAFRAAAAVGAPFAGVDLLPARDGTLYAIEVNAVPGWKALAAVTDVDVAAIVLDYLAEVAR